MRVVRPKQHGRIPKGENLLNRRFLLDRTGTFDAMHQYMELSRSLGTCSMHWYPNVIEWLGFQFLYNRLLPFQSVDSRTEGMPTMTRPEFAGFLQYLQKTPMFDGVYSIIRPSTEVWPSDTFRGERVPLFKGSAGRPVSPQDTSPWLTELDLLILADFFNDQPGLLDTPWERLIRSPASILRLIDIARFSGAAFTEVVRHPATGRGVDIRLLANCPNAEDTWVTEVSVNSGLGRVIIPVHNEIPAIDFPGFHEEG